MIYDVRHVTTYGYSRQVPFARCIMRLLPRDGSGQSVLKSEVSITPRPAERSDAPCFFGNRMTLATITKPHRELKVEMRARVVVERPAPPHPGLTRNWEEVSALALASDSLEPGSPAHQIYPSRLVPEVDAVVAYARESFGKGRPVLEAASELMARIRRDFTYDPAATEVSTPLAEAFAQRHGVCQDFAHIMIAVARVCGIPTRYVSGYLYHRGSHDRSRADATHAWVESYLPSLGWIGFDPTNNIQARDRHIRAAVGRDYADVPPTRGTYKGGAESELSIAVALEPTAAPVRQGDLLKVVRPVSVPASCAPHACPAQATAARPHCPRRPRTPAPPPGCARRRCRCA